MRLTPRRSTRVWDLLQRLQRGNQLLRLSLSEWLLSRRIGRSQYFCSEKIHCPSCLTYKGSKARYATRTRFCKRSSSIHICAKSCR